MFAAQTDFPAVFADDSRFSSYKIYFPKQIESIEDAKEHLTFLHERVTHITYPTFIQGVIVTFLWMMFYLPYAHRNLLPLQVEPFCPSPPVAGWILIILFITHFLESILGENDDKQCVQVKPEKFFVVWGSLSAEMPIGT